MRVGIVGYGAYIPRFRITSQEIAQAWQQDGKKIHASLGIEEKAVPNKDEDTATIAIESAKHALARAAIAPDSLGALYVGSESHPYAVKPTAGIVGSALRVGTNYMAADVEFACKAGTAALQLVYGLVRGGQISYGLAIGADTAQAEPGDILEYGTGAGGGAFIVGNNANELVATIEHTLSYTTDTPDFWRRPLQKYPQHHGRFTGEPSYFSHVIAVTQQILTQANLSVDDIAHVVFHQPNGRFPVRAAKKLGITTQQLQAGLLSPKIGNTYSGCSMVSLAAVLDVAEPGQTILVTSYGSGSGCDAFIFKTTEHVKTNRTLAPVVASYIERKTYLSYSSYRQHIAHI